MTDTLTSIRWIINTLKADTTVKEKVDTRVYAGLAPRGATYPLIVVSKMAATPVRATSNGAGAFMFDELVLVTAISEGADNTVPANIINGVRTALDTKSGTASAGVVIGCVEEMEVPLPVEITDGVTYSKSALEFRVYTQ